MVKKWHVPIYKEQIQQQYFQVQEEEENEEEHHLEDLHSDESHTPSIPIDLESGHEEAEPQEEQEQPSITKKI